MPTAVDHRARVSAGALSKLDPEFRTERARKAAEASNGAKGVITRFLRVLPDLTPEQVEIIRRALPPAETTRGGGADG